MSSTSGREWLEEFIEIYRSEPCLWQIKSKEYHNRELKRLAYMKLIDKLKIIEPGADKDSVVKKVNNIRSRYKKEHKKVIDSVKSGVGALEVYVPRLWYYHLLQFLDDQAVPRRSRSNIEDENSENEDPRNETSQSILSTTSTSQSRPAIESTQSPPAIKSTQSIPAIESTESLPSTSTAGQAATSKPRLPPGKRSANNLNEKLTTDVLLSVQNHFKKPAHNKDRFDIFGVNVAAKLRDLTKQQRILADKIINETLFEAEMDNLTISYQVMDSARIRSSSYAYSTPSPTVYTPSPTPFQQQDYEYYDTNSNFDLQMQQVPQPTKPDSQSTQRVPQPTQQVSQPRQQVSEPMYMLNPPVVPISVPESASTYLSNFDIN